MPYENNKAIPSNVYYFEDYRDFLKDRYRQLKMVDSCFSFRVFSKEAGFSSPNYLKLVMDRKRNLSEEGIEKFAKGLRLEKHEAEYFKYLVLHNQCEHPIKKQIYEAKLQYLKELFNLKIIIPELYDYYRDWYHSAIRELIRKGPVVNNPAAIAKKLVPSISVEEARESIQLLEKLNYIEKTEDGYLRIVEKTEELSPSGSDSPQNKVYYEQMAELAALSVYTQQDLAHDFESITISLPEHRVEEIKERIRALVSLIRQVNSQDPSDAIYQFNVQLFAVTKPASRKARKASSFPRALAEKKKGM